MDIGIDKIGMYVPPYALDLTLLAKARHVDPDKYTKGIGQEKMAVSPVTQDIITFGAQAASSFLTASDRKEIGLLVVGTESSIDESKASAILLQDLLNIQPFCRCIETKQACYGATAGLLMAKDFVTTHPGKKALVIATDIARYGLNTGGEVTQGAGAVAMLVTERPRLIALEHNHVSYTQNIYDFWRPTGQRYPLVDGPLSNETYVKSFEQVWEEYKKRYCLDFSDFKALLFHTPYTKMGKKALTPYLDKISQNEQERLLTAYEKSIQYSKQIGNLYTGSLYLSFLSLLDHDESLKENDRLGFFSYGSGCTAEFFSGKLMPQFKQYIKKEKQKNQLNNRSSLSIEEYEIMFEETLEENKYYHDETLFSITYYSDYQRQYKKDK